MYYISSNSEILPKKNNIATLAQLSASDLLPVYLPVREGDIAHSLADISKAKIDLNFAPDMNFLDGLKKDIRMVCQRIQITKPLLKRFFLMLLAYVVMTGCVTHKKLRYMTDLTGDTISKQVIDSTYSYRLKPGDVLYIKVVSSTDSKMELFNQSLSNNRETGVGNPGQVNLMAGNLIDQYGDIELPMVGLIKVSGFTLKEAEQLINGKMSEYLTYVTVTLKLMSFRISVLGEVGSPGIKSIDRANVTVLDALSYAGDLTDLGNRKKVRLIRRENNRNKVYTIDMTSVSMLSSEFYYLRPDDVIYVEPLKYKVVKVNSPTIALAFSAFSITLAIFAVLSR